MNKNRQENENKRSIKLLWFCVIINSITLLLHSFQIRFLQKDFIYLIDALIKGL